MDRQPPDTGAFDRNDTPGIGGRTLKEQSRHGSRTYLGLQVEGFPNKLTLVGPHNAARRLFSKVVSWFLSINRNLPGKQKRRFLLYSGGAPAYREKCEEAAANGYAGFELQ